MIDSSLTEDGLSNYLHISITSDYESLHLWTKSEKIGIVVNECNGMLE
jgi:hypothetical protein